jgi:hypothetical protein
MEEEDRPSKTFACEDDWPFDVVSVPGSKGKFHYGIIPPAFFNVVTETFKQYWLSGRTSFISVDRKIRDHEISVNARAIVPHRSGRI